MAERTLLHKTKLQDFTQWLITDGWTIERAKGGYEILRARKSGRKYPFIAYDRNNAEEHYSVADRDTGVIHTYLKTTNQKNRAPAYRTQNHCCVKSKLKLKLNA